MKLASAVAAALFLAAPSPAAMPEQPGSARWYPHNPAAIVRLECHEPDGGGAIGTGVKVGRHTYITAAHVVDGRQCYINGVPVLVTQSGGEKLDYAVFLGPENDVMIPATCDGYRAGQSYLARGYAFGGYAANAEPWIATRIPWGPLEMFSGFAAPGMSGGPVMDKRGRVIGIVNTRNPSMSLPLDHTPLCA